MINSHTDLKFMKLVKIDPLLPLEMINIFGSDEIKQRELRVFWRFILLVT